MCHSNGAGSRWWRRWSSTVSQRQHGLLLPLLLLLPPCQISQQLAEVAVMLAQVAHHLAGQSAKVLAKLAKKNC